jgi:hypothetical protein
VIIIFNKKDFNNISFGYSIFIGTTPKIHLKAYKILSFLPKSGIILTIARPTDNILSILGKKINGYDLYFIDSVSKSIGYHKEHKNAIYLDSPYSLTSMNIALDKMLHTFKDKNTFLIFDSLSKLAFYHDASKLYRFMNSLINKCRSTNTGLVILGIEEDLPIKLKDGIEEMCDKVLKL